MVQEQTSKPKVWKRGNKLTSKAKAYLSYMLKQYWKTKMTKTERKVFKEKPVFKEQKYKRFSLVMSNQYKGDPDQDFDIRAVIINPKGKKDVKAYLEKSLENWWDRWARKFVKDGDYTERKSKWKGQVIMESYEQETIGEDETYFPVRTKDDSFKRDAKGRRRAEQRLNKVSYDFTAPETR